MYPLRYIFMVFLIGTFIPLIKRTRCQITSHQVIHTIWNSTQDILQPQVGWHWIGQLQHERCRVSTDRADDGRGLDGL